MLFAPLRLRLYPRHPCHRLQSIVLVEFASFQEVSNETKPVSRASSIRLPPLHLDNTDEDYASLLESLNGVLRSRSTQMLLKHSVRPRIS